MADTILPTAANIISSLGIKGATVSDALPGYVPVLGPNGQLSAKFIPSDATQVSVPSLSDAAFIDPNTNVQESIRKGSVVAPYKTLREAALKFRPSDAAQNLKTVAFVLAPGVYDDDGNEGVIFQEGWNEVYPSKGNPSRVFLIGIGACKFYRDIVVSGIDAAAPESELVFQNIDLGDSGNLTVIGSVGVTLLGNTYVGGTVSAGSFGGVPQNVKFLRVSADSYVGSIFASSITFLSKSANVKNTSSVKGDTVSDALDRIGSRKIRVAKVTGSGSGLCASSFQDISADSSGGFDVYRLGANECALISAIKDLYGRLNDINARSVTADDITATGSLTAKTLRIDALKLGECLLEIDTYGYLVVSEGHEHVDPPYGSVVLTDVGDGSLWLLGVHDEGRLFVERYYDSGFSSDGSDVQESYPESIDLVDLGVEYKVEIRNGRMSITKEGVS